MKTKPDTTKSKHATPRDSAAGQQDVELVPLALKIKNILVPVDFSDPSRKAVKYAIQFAQQFDAKLTLVHVVEPIGMPDFDSFPLAADTGKIVRAVKARLELLCKQEALCPPMLQGVQVRQGKAFQEIVEVARTAGMDLIVIATHGYTGLQLVLLGSTTERVVRHAPCPVLVVRESGRKSS
jgi:nucleotide-binding universal stress UspA family protein